MDDVTEETLPLAEAKCPGDQRVFCANGRDEEVQARLNHYLAAGWQLVPESVRMMAGGPQGGVFLAVFAVLTWPGAPPWLQKLQAEAAARPPAPRCLGRTCSACGGYVSFDLMATWCYGCRMHFHYTLWETLSPWEGPEPERPAYTWVPPPAAAPR